MIPSAMPCACRSPRALQMTNRSAIVDTSEMLSTRMSSAFLSLAASTTRSASARGGRAVTDGDLRARTPSPIAAALLYVLPHRVRNKVPQGHPASGAGAQLAGADIEQGRVERACSMRGIRLGSARSCCDEDRGQLADPVWFAPA